MTRLEALLSEDLYKMDNKETKTYELSAVVPPSTASGVRFVRLEMANADDEYSPLAVVWYTLLGDQTEYGSRIDLQKQIFLDNFGDIDHNSFETEARLIVAFLSLFY